MLLVFSFLLDYIPFSSYSIFFLLLLTGMHAKKNYISVALHSDLRQIDSSQIPLSKPIIRADCPASV